MAAGHALRGLASAGLALVVLETVARSNTANVGGLVSTVGNIVQRALSPSVPLIPDRRTAGAGSDASQRGYITPAQAAAGAKVAANLPAVDALTALGANPSLGQYLGGGGLSGIGANPGIYAPIPSTGAAPGRAVR